MNDGTAINNSYLANSNSTISDGYFVGAVNLALGTGTEMTTNVKSNRQEGKYGEDSLYKSKQTGEFEFIVNIKRFPPATNTGFFIGVTVHTRFWWWVNVIG